MNLLLDTHALLWFLEDAPQLSPIASAAISNPANRCFVSDATAWEVGIKLSLGKLVIPIPYAELFPHRLLKLGFHILPIRHSHLHHLVALPWHHRDPFDRLMIAQALNEDMTIISRDTFFPEYGIPILW